jgi:hypothetical protein
MALGIERRIRGRSCELVNARRPRDLVAVEHLHAPRREQQRCAGLDQVAAVEQLAVCDEM